MTGDELTAVALQACCLPGWQTLDGTLPDLSDTLTGGHMLALLGRGVCVTRLTSNGRYLVMQQALAESGATLAEACARLAIRQGYWHRGSSNGSA